MNLQLSLNYLHVQYNLLEEFFQNNAFLFHVCIHSQQTNISCRDYWAKCKLLATRNYQISKTIRNYAN